MTEHTPRPSRPQLYARLGFGFVVLFGLVGSIAGYHMAAAFVLISAVAAWSVVRILEEAVDAWQQLYGPPPPAAPVGDIKTIGHKDAAPLCASRSN